MKIYDTLLPYGNASRRRFYTYLALQIKRLKTLDSVVWSTVGSRVKK